MPVIRYGIAGRPVDHSLSPLLMALVCDHLGLNTNGKNLDMELVDVTSGEVFGDEKTLIFIQTLNGKEYKIDYSKAGTSMFIRVHQDSIF